ncbi:MAG: hypothetical protein WAO23_02285 [Dethiobacteria bacterium]
MIKGLEVKLATLAFTFILLLFIALITYFIFFNRSPEPPRRSLPVTAVIGTIHTP